MIFEKKTMKKVNITILSMIAGSLLVSSCGKKDPLSPGTEFMPDMYYSEALKPYELNPIFSDSLQARKPVPGTVSQGAFPNSPISIDAYFYPYPDSPEGYEAAGANLANPIAKDSLVLLQGQEIYTKYCTPCHGDAGDGNGSLVQIGKFPNPGAYWAKEGLTQGKMFHTLTYGKGLMGSHASQLTKTERWKVVHWVQKFIDDKKASEAPKTAENTTETNKSKS